MGSASMYNEQDQGEADAAPPLEKDAAFRPQHEVERDLLRSPRREGLAATIRAKVKLFDDGEVTEHRPIHRELDYTPRDGEFDVSRSVFDHQYSTMCDIERLCIGNKQHQHDTRHAAGSLLSLPTSPTRIKTFPTWTVSPPSLVDAASNSSQKPPKEKKKSKVSGRKGKDRKLVLRDVPADSNKPRASKDSEKSSLSQQEGQWGKPIFGNYHRPQETVIRPQKPLTTKRRFARRASTGRLLDPTRTNTWRLNATHSVQISHDSEDAAALNPMENVYGASTSHKDKEGKAARPSFRRVIRRLSTGSVITPSNESEDQLIDFWHSYESLHYHGDSATSDSELEKSYVRKRTSIRFDQNTTVWVFTQDDVPMTCDLELPQSFVPDNRQASQDFAPRLPLRRRNSDTESLPIDSAPVAPPRRLSSSSLDSITEHSDETEATIEDLDDMSVDSWPQLVRITRQTLQRQQRRKERSKRVRFAEELEQVRLFEKDNVPEVVLPQIGIIFCGAMSEMAEAHAPQAPKRHYGWEDDPLSDLSKTLQALRQHEGFQREIRDFDLKPRCPVRMGSLRSLDSQSSDKISGYQDVTQRQTSSVNRSLRPTAMRGDSIADLHSSNDLTFEKCAVHVRPDSEYSMRPSTMRGDSFNSLASTVSSSGQSFRSGSVKKDSNHFGYALRPSTIRGDSFNSLASTVSSSGQTFTCHENGANVYGLAGRPCRVRGNSFRSLGGMSTSSSENSFKQEKNRPTSTRLPCKNDSLRSIGFAESPMEIYLPGIAPEDSFAHGAGSQSYHAESAKDLAKKDILWQGADYVFRDFIEPPPASQRNHSAAHRPFAKDFNPQKPPVIPENDAEDFSEGFSFTEASTTTSSPEKSPLKQKRLSFLGSTRQLRIPRSPNDSGKPKLLSMFVKKRGKHARYQNV